MTMKGLSNARPVQAKLRYQRYSATQNPKTALWSSTFAAAQQCIVLSYALCYGAFVEAYYFAFQTLVYVIGPQWAARNSPESLGVIWMLADLCRASVSLAMGFGLVPCTMMCSALLQRGYALVLLYELLHYGCFNQCDLPQALIARAANACGWCTLFHRVGMEPAWLMALGVFAVTGLVAVLLDRYRCSAFTKAQTSLPAHREQQYIPPVAEAPPSPTHSAWGATGSHQGRPSSEYPTNVPSAATISERIAAYYMSGGVDSTHLTTEPILGECTPDDEDSDNSWDLLLSRAAKADGPQRRPWPEAEADRMATCLASTSSGISRPGSSTETSGDHAAAFGKFAAGMSAFSGGANSAHLHDSAGSNDEWVRQRKAAVDAGAKGGKAGGQITLLPPGHSLDKVYGSEFEGLEGCTVFCSLCNVDGSAGYTEGCPECGGGSEMAHLEGEDYEVKLREVDELMRTTVQRLCAELDEQAYDVVQVNIAVPWSDPSELPNGAVYRIQQLLQNGTHGRCQLLGAAVRRGSLLVALDIIVPRAGAEQEPDPKEPAPHPKADVSATGPTGDGGDVLPVAPAEWLECLELPGPREGESEAVVQICGETHAVHWDDLSQRWVGGSSDGSTTTASSYVEPPAPRMSAESGACEHADALSPVAQTCLSRPSSMEHPRAGQHTSLVSDEDIKTDEQPIKRLPALAVVVDCYVNRGCRPCSATLRICAADTFDGGLGRGGLVLKARVRGQIVPVFCTPVQVAHSGPYSGNLTDRAEQPTTQPATQLSRLPSAQPVFHDLLITLDLSALPAPENSHGGWPPTFAMLEVWQGYVVLQSVPLLLLGPDRAEVAAELSELSYDLATCQPSDGSLHDSRLVARLAACLSYMASLPPTSSSAAASDLNGCEDTSDESLHTCMVATARSLLCHAIVKGWLAVACELVGGLVGRCGLKYKELYVGAGNKDGNSLLHLAVCTCKCAMIAQVVRWGEIYGCPCSWSVRNHYSCTPLHLAVFLDRTGRLASEILRRFEASHWVWSSIRDRMGNTPAMMAMRLGHPVVPPNNSAAARRRTRPLMPLMTAPAPQAHLTAESLAAVRNITAAVGARLGAVGTPVGGGGGGGAAGAPAQGLDPLATVAFLEAAVSAAAVAAAHQADLASSRRRSTSSSGHAYGIHLPSRLQHASHSQEPDCSEGPMSDGGLTIGSFAPSVFEELFSDLTPGSDTPQGPGTAATTYSIFQHLAAAGHTKPVEGAAERHQDSVLSAGQPVPKAGTSCMRGAGAMAADEPQQRSKDTSRSSREPAGIRRWCRSAATWSRRLYRDLCPDWPASVEQHYTLWCATHGTSYCRWHGAVFSVIAIISVFRAIREGAYGDITSHAVILLMMTYGLAWANKWCPSHMGLYWAAADNVRAWTILAYGLRLVSCVSFCRLLHKSSVTFLLLAEALLMGPQHRLQSRLRHMLLACCAMPAAYVPLLLQESTPHPLLHALALGCVMAATAIIVDWRRRRMFWAAVGSAAAMSARVKKE